MGGAGAGGASSLLSAEAIARAQAQFDQWRPAFDAVMAAQENLNRARAIELTTARDVFAARQAVLDVEAQIAGLAAPHSERARALEAQIRTIDIGQLEKDIAKATGRERLEMELRLERLRIDAIRAAKQGELDAARAALAGKEAVLEAEKLLRDQVIKRAEQTLTARQAELEAITGMIALENLRADLESGRQQATLDNLQKQYELAQRIAAAQGVAVTAAAAAAAPTGVPAGSAQTAYTSAALARQLSLAEAFQGQTAENLAYIAGHMDEQIGTGPNAGRTFRELYVNEINKRANLPHFQYGGIVPGAPGSPQVIMAHGGERVTPRGQAGVNVAFNAPVYGLMELKRMITETVRDAVAAGGLPELARQ